MIARIDSVVGRILKVELYIIVNSSTVTDSPLANATWPIERADERRQRCRCDAVNSQSAAGPADTKDAESKRLLRP